MGFSQISYGRSISMVSMEPSAICPICNTGKIVCAPNLRRFIHFTHAQYVANIGFIMVIMSSGHLTKII